MHFIQYFSFCVLGLIGVFLMQAVLGQLVEGNTPAYQVLTYHLMGLPAIFVQMTPPAVLMATVLTLAVLSRSNELIACHSIGVGLNQVMLVILSLVFMISCFSLVLQDRILPPFHNKQMKYKWTVMDKKSDFYFDFGKEKIWYRSGNLIYNLRHFDGKTKTITGMSVYSFDEDFNLLQVIQAARAEYRPNGWELLDGKITVFAGNERYPVTQSFEKKFLPVPETPTEFMEIEREVEGFRLKDLKHYIEKIEKAGADTKEYWVKFHYRISLSFIPLVMALLAIPFSVGLRRQGGIVRDLAIGLGVTVFYWLFYSVGLSLGKSGALLPWISAWLPSFVFAASAIVLIWHRFRRV